MSGVRGNFRSKKIGEVTYGLASSKQQTGAFLSNSVKEQLEASA